jgi:hypothetical protein
LAKAAATAETENEKPKDYLTRRRNGDTVAGVRLNNNTAITYKANGDFLEKLTGETVAGVRLNNYTASTTQSER